MAKENPKTASKTIPITLSSTSFSSLYHFRLPHTVYEFNQNGVTQLRQLLSHQKARLLHIIKTKNPLSIYHLAKILGRDFKAVSNDAKLLQEFGLVALISTKHGKRKALKPVLVLDKLDICLQIS